MLWEQIHEILVDEQRCDYFPDPHAQTALRERPPGHLGGLGRNLIRQAWTQRHLDHLTLAPPRRSSHHPDAARSLGKHCRIRQRCPSWDAIDRFEKLLLAVCRSATRLRTILTGEHFKQLTDTRGRGPPPRTNREGRVKVRQVQMDRMHIEAACALKLVTTAISDKHTPVERYAQAH